MKIVIASTILLAVCSAACVQPDGTNGEGPVVIIQQLDPSTDRAKSAVALNSEEVRREIPALAEGFEEALGNGRASLTGDQMENAVSYLVEEVGSTSADVIFEEDAFSVKQVVT